MWKFCVPLDIFDYLHLPLPVQAKVNSHYSFRIYLFFSFTKIALLYSGSVFTLKNQKKPPKNKKQTKKQFKCKCIKTSRWKPWHLDSAAEWILALLHTNELKVRDKEHLLGISSGCPAGPGRRRCPRGLVPFWTPPAKHKHVVTFKRGWITRCWTNRVSAECFPGGGGIKVNEMSLIYHAWKHNMRWSFHKITGLSLLYRIKMLLFFF